tara:strand:- start:1574 stop:2359 length:786 start_codon:yes stop_codon:yes gene_type:complete
MAKTMSKRIKLKFKKILKKAEFVHADLEYHEELFEDAKEEFNLAFTSIVEALDKDDRDTFEKLREKEMNDRIAELEKRNKEAAEAAAGREDNPEGTEEDSEEKNQNTNLLITEEFPEGIELNPDREDEIPEIKASEMKKIFYKIATLTHPDKQVAKNLTPKQTEEVEKTFKRAKDAYEKGNWYVLYSIATELGIEVGDIDDRHIEWIENDVRLTMGRIAQLAQLAAWVWYVADEKGKETVMKGYLKQAYNFDWNPVPNDVS